MGAAPRARKTRPYGFGSTAEAVPQRSLTTSRGLCMRKALCQSKRNECGIEWKWGDQEKF